MSTGPIHTVTVHRRSMARDDATYDIDHGGCDLRGDACLVEQMFTEFGVESAIFGHSETHDRLADGAIIRVMPWAAVYRSLDYGDEYDGGLDVLSVGRRVETATLTGEHL